MIINKKLLLNVIITAALALVLLSGFIIFCSKSIINNVLLNKSKEQLMLIRDFKKEQLEVYFSDLKKHMELLANEQMVQNGYMEFKTAFEQLVESNTQEPQKQNYINLKIAQHYNNIVKQYKEHTGNKDKIDFSVFLQNLNPHSIMLQSKYLTEQSESYENSPGIVHYSGVHDKYHTFFRKIMDEFKYNDLLLVDLNGNIIYSTKKNIDFASSIETGAFSNSEIANAFNAAKYTNANEESVVISNFSEYLPDYQEPLLFVAKKIQNVGVLITSIGLSTINSLLKLPEKTENTVVYLIDQDLHLITPNHFGKNINTVAAREAATGKKGFVEGLNANKAVALSYFAPIEDRALSIIVESNKNVILQNLYKSIKNILMFTGAIIPILLFFVYTICCLCIEKADNKLNKISTFMQVVLAKKDLNSRISLKNTDANGIADIINNLLSWFQNTLDQVAVKIKQFINKYNNLLNNVAALSNQTGPEQQLNVIKANEQLQCDLVQHVNAINNHQEACLALNNLTMPINQKPSTVSLTSSIEYILNVCNLADMLALHVSLEASKTGNQPDNNFLLLSKEIKKMVNNLKSRLTQIKSSFDEYLLEQDTAKNFIAEFSEKLKPINKSLEVLLESQKVLLSSSANSQALTVDLENKYNMVTRQLSTIVEDHNNLNVELQMDDYYPFKVVESTSS